MPKKPLTKIKLMKKLHRRPGMHPAHGSSYGSGTSGGDLNGHGDHNVKVTVLDIIEEFGEPLTESQQCTVEEIVKNSKNKLKTFIVFLLIGLAACGSEPGKNYTGEGQPIKCMAIESCDENPLSFACSHNREVCGCNGESQEEIDNECEGNLPYPGQLLK